MDFIKENAKAVATFVITVLLAAATDVLSGKVPWPTTWAEAGKYFGAALIAAAVVWLTGNKLDLGQILSGMRKLPVPEQQVVAEETLTHLPDTVSDDVVSGYPNWASG